MTVSIYFDGGNSRATKWTQGASAGAIVAGGNGVGSDVNQLIDHGNNRVTKWPPDAANGTVIAGGYGIGSNVNQLSYPYAVSVSYSSSSIWIADIGTHRIWNICGNGHNQLCYPASVVVDSNGYIYITDSFNSRIMRWMLGSRSWYCCRWKLNVPIANLGSSSTTRADRNDASTGIRHPRVWIFLLIYSIIRFMKTARILFHQQ
ncbi:unnamed protein product [Adineta ricciae]|uniref:NHL repeat containing protein n=1 Tax=Adineta ricciae TaxID=249248 RepID=A0A815GI38_ADIRI|nr:unnamed protein product [Adineta ricciae]